MVSGIDYPKLTGTSLCVSRVLEDLLKFILCRCPVRLRNLYVPWRNGAGDYSSMGLHINGCRISIANSRIRMPIFRIHQTIDESERHALLRFVSFLAYQISMNIFISIPPKLAIRIQWVLHRRDRKHEIVGSCIPSC
ncbi:hypothetical protein CEXT_510071 [Caerostris extrusa]|uniref:Uncharacterized protein n=1 Tax=Caerostris extrusa TaxID=172846 RepID=A0AAV4NMD9_CAEEX|nr:hypothetical protein CEXT_510071 [Caerostris extrusa]